MPKKNSPVESFFSSAGKWHPEMQKLRSIVREFPLVEELKWGKPCYSYNGANVVLIVPFKPHCILLMCKGALLPDPAKILVQPTEHTQGARQIRFTSLEEIVEKETVLKRYLQAAVEVERQGLEVTYKKITEFKIPAELETIFRADPRLKTAFRALTPGRQRAYLLHFSSAKQAATRKSRIEKCRKQILAGKGLLD